MSVDKLVDSTQLDTDLTSVANAIRTKGGTSASLAFPVGFVSAIQAIPSGGGTDYLAALLTNTLSSYTDNTITEIKVASFMRASIGSMTLSALTKISASQALFGLTCSSLSLPLLAQVTADNVMQNASVGDTLALPSFTRLAGGYFLNNASVKTLNALNLEFIGSNGFQDSKLIIACYPKAWVRNNAFASARSLATVDIYTGTSNNSATTQELMGNTFLNCNSLTTLILRTTTICPLNNINAFQGSPFASGGSGGTLYVPNDLLTQYAQASNWSTILSYTNNQIKSIESTHTDPTAPIDLTLYYADGTPISA